MDATLLTPEIKKLAKSLKKDMVMITPHFICGCDSPQMSTFSITYLQIPVDENLFYCGPVGYMDKYDMYLETEYQYYSVRGRLLDMKQKCLFVEQSGQVLYQALSILIGQEYELPGLSESMAMKAKEGAMMVSNLDRYAMSSCGTLHPVNKKDDMNVTLYAYDDVSFLAKYDIIKKTHTIYEYMRFLYV